MLRVSEAAPPGVVTRARSIGSLADRETRAAVRWGVNHGLPRVAMRNAARRGDLQGRLIVGASGGDDVMALIEEVRAAGPLPRGRFSYLAARREDVREVLTSDDFRTGFPGAGGPLERLAAWSEIDVLHPVGPPSLLVTEPPDHTRMRKLVTRVFTVRAVERLRARTEEIAAGLLDTLPRGEPVDLVAAYCAQLPVNVIAEILGVPPDQRPRVLELGTAAAPSLDMGLPWRRFREVERALVDFDRWLTGHLRWLREHPGDDLMSQLVAVEEDGAGLTERELKSTAGLVLAAGFETTVNLLGNGIALLHAHPEQRARLQAEPDLWSNAVDEVLRLDPPVLMTGRTCVRDTVVAGVPVRRGAMVTTILAGANRDPEVFADPGAFDVGRDNAREHVSFSAGRHYCLGAALARMEGEVGLRAFVDRFADDLELLPGARRRDTRILRGFETLPARVGR